MISVYSEENIASIDYVWLKARHHFNPSNDNNVHRKHFGKLRILNDDTIKAGSGFDMHHHKDMEIITIVKSGAITHKDSKGNMGRTEAGNVQVMSAGTGIYHSEFNLESEETNLYQIWIEPKQKDVKPRWEMATFANSEATGSLPLLVSGRPEDKSKGALFIHQDASIFYGRVAMGQEIFHQIKCQIYMVIVDGEIEISGRIASKGDGVGITEQDALTFKALTNTQVILIDVPV